MIRAIQKRPDGSVLLLLGVDDTNIERLTSGKPIHVEGAMLGIPVDVVIMHGHTMQDVVDELKASGIEVPVDRVPIAEPGRPVIMSGKPQEPKGTA